jgi:ABC-type multidrug transport system fused ATPase/permease subunit
VALRSWWRDDVLLAESSGGPVAPARAYPAREILRRLWPEARPLRWWLALAVLLATVLPALQAVNVWLWKLLVDHVLVPHDLGALPPIALGFVAVTLLGGALTFGSRYLSTWLSGTFVLGFRMRLFAHLHTLSLDFFERRKLGDLLQRLSGDVGEVETFLVSGAVNLISYAVSIVIFSSLLLYLQWRLALVALLLAPLFWLVARQFSKRVKQSVREQRRFSGAASSVAEESLHNIALVQAYGRGDAELARYRLQGELGRRSKLRTTRVRGALTPVTDAIELVGALAIFAIGTWQVRAGHLTIGGFLAFVVYLGKLFSPIRAMGRLTNTLYAAAAGAERVLEMLDERPSIADAPGARRLTSVRGALELDGVTFTYPGVTRPSVRDVTLSVAAGETVALVGASGAGKSTIAKLLLRFYDPQAGAVRLDGQDLRSIRLDSLRDHVAVMWQEALVFDGSIAENIAYGRSGVTEEEVLRAGSAAGLDEVAARLDGGYDAPVGQKGRLLSGGQRQRVAIARAMVRDAPVLILDEPTSNLDAASAQRVLRPLRDLVAGRTTVIISHNLLTVRDADRIVVLDVGEIVSVGTHETLLETCPLYADLYTRSQGGGAIAEPA